MAVDQRHRLGRVPALHQHHPRARDKRLFQCPAVPADMGHRRWHQRNVLAARSGLDGGNQRHPVQRVVRMQHRLGRAGRARRIQPQLYRIGIDLWQRALRCAADGQQCAKTIAAIGGPHMHHVKKVGQSGTQSIHHGGKVVIAEHLGDKHDPRAAVAQHPAGFGIAIDRHDRADHQPGQPRGQIDHRRLDPVRQLKGDAVALDHPHIEQRARQRFTVGKQAGISRGGWLSQIDDTPGIALRMGPRQRSDRLVRPDAGSGVAAQMRRDSSHEGLFQVAAWRI